MRDLLNKSLAILIWTATFFFIVCSCYVGAMIIRYGAAGGVQVTIGGFLCIVFGVTMSFVFAGICFQIMDIRTFTKYAAFNAKGGRR